MKWIVECSICGQPWGVDEPLVSAPPLYGIQVPDHGMLNQTDSQPSMVPCPGPQVPGLGLGVREQWEQNWTLRRPLRPRPQVLDGAGVKLITGR
jgi:hypothetical protein